MSTANTATAPQAGTQEKERRVEVPGPNALQLAEHGRNPWYLKVAKGVQPEDLLEPAFWANHSGKLAPYDKIEVRAEDGTWYQELIVMDSSRAWARVKPLIPAVRFSTSDVSQSETVQTQFEVMHRGPRGWSVVRTKDREVMHDGEKLRGGAEQWLKDNLPKLMAGQPA